MIKAIIFDISGVCSYEEEIPHIMDFAKRYNLDQEDVIKIYTNFVLEAERDHISAFKIWEEIAERFNLKVDIEKEITTMISKKKFYTEMLEFASSFRPRYKVAAYSNYNKIYWEQITKSIDLSQYFDIVLASFMVKARKTEKAGFEFLIKKFGVKPKEIVFLDDSENNLTAANKLGINTILYKSKEQLIREFKKLGMEVRGEA
ncbi:MAG: HAD family phosphatase [Candidatus Woesearchaeota archaeon]